MTLAKYLKEYSNWDHVVVCKQRKGIHVPSGYIRNCCGRLFNTLNCQPTVSVRVRVSQSVVVVDGWPGTQLAAAASARRRPGGWRRARTEQAHNWTPKDLIDLQHDFH